MRIVFFIFMCHSLLFSSFIKEGNIVKDNVSGLQWQDDKLSSNFSWEGAIDYCENLILDGYDDWRLPNINELKTIVDRRNYLPAIIETFDFIYTGNSNNHYWSSTSPSMSSGTAATVDFMLGSVNPTFSKNSGGGIHVRCVRAGR